MVLRSASFYVFEMMCNHAMIQQMCVFASKAHLVKNKNTYLLSAIEVPATSLSSRRQGLGIHPIDIQVPLILINNDYGTLFVSNRSITLVAHWLPIAYCLLPVAYCLFQLRYCWYVFGLQATPMQPTSVTLRSEGQWWASCDTAAALSKRAPSKCTCSNWWAWVRTKVNTIRRQSI